MEHVDLDAVRELVREWIAAHDDRTLSEMVEDLQGNFPEGDREDMAVVLRGYALAELRRPPEIPPDPAAAGGAR